MINKQNIWFLTLFSLVLVLSVYYITMPNELLITNSSDTLKEETNEDTKTVSIEEATVIETMKVENDTEIQETIKELEQTLTSMDISIEEKNTAYEQIKNINKNSAQEETIEGLLKDKYGYECFVKIKENQIRVVIGSEDGNTTLANEIMRLVQEKFDKKMYISVQFSV